MIDVIALRNLAPGGYIFSSVIAIVGIHRQGLMGLGGSDCLLNPPAARPWSTRRASSWRALAWADRLLGRLARRRFLLSWTDRFLGRFALRFRRGLLFRRETFFLRADGFAHGLAWRLRNVLRRWPVSFRSNGLAHPLARRLGNAFNRTVLIGADGFFCRHLYRFVRNFLTYRLVLRPHAFASRLGWLG